MPLKKIFVVLTISFSGCLVPKQPVIEMCHLSYESDSCYCAMTDTPELVQEYSLDYCDKATAFRPREWEQIKNYIDELQVYIEKGCRP